MKDYRFGIRVAGSSAVPNEEERVHGEGGVADGLEEEVPLGDGAQRLVFWSRDSTQETGDRALRGGDSEGRERAF